ncbi:MAG: hypothetical protein LC749_18035 [Actinobacteria bacterium]|nr:hypothetical protein [Actinomycetota bacterium]
MHPLRGCSLRGIAYGDGAEQAACGGMGGHGASQQPVQPSLQVSMILRQGAVLELVPSPADRHGPEQQDAKARGEALIAFLDRIVCVAQQMRQAHLTDRAIAAGDPPEGRTAKPS